MIPLKIFCFRCGEGLRVQEITDKKSVEDLRRFNFVGAGKFICGCGVVGIFYMKKMPDKPTFTVTFDIYRSENVAS